MPRYSITNAQFSPFSYAEMVKPYELAAEKYDKQLAAYDKIAEDVDAVDYLAQTLPEDSPYRERYDTFMKEFNTLGDNLSQGWSPDTASKLAGLRKMYHNTLVPLQKADVARTEMMKTQNTMRAKDPTLRFEVDASDPNSLQYFLDNPGTAAIKSYSPDEILKTAAAQIKNLKEEAYRQKAFESLGKEGTLLLQNTLSNADIQDVIENPELYPNINAIINSAIDRSGLENWSDERKTEELNGALNSALFGVSVGLTSASDPTYISPEKQRELDIRELQATARATKATRTSSTGSGSGHRKTKTQTGGEQPFSVEKGDPTRVDDQKVKDKISAAGYQPVSNWTSRAGTNGRIIANGKSAPASTGTSGTEITADSVRAMYSGNTYNDYKAKAEIAQITGGYLDAFTFYSLGNDASGNPMLLIKAKPTETVGSYYNYSREGYNPNFKFNYQSDEDFKTAVKAINNKDNREKARSLGKRFTYIINTNGEVEVAFIPPESTTQIGRYVDPSELNTTLLQPQQSAPTQTPAQQAVDSTVNSTQNNTNIPRIPRR